MLRAKVNQLLTDYAYASLVNGVKVDMFVPDRRWFRNWEAEYGLSMRKPNRRYQVPKNVLMERPEIFWVNLLRLRLLMKLLLGYEPPKWRTLIKARTTTMKWDRKTSQFWRSRA